MGHTTHSYSIYYEDVLSDLYGPAWRTCLCAMLRYGPVAQRSDNEFLLQGGVIGYDERHTQGLRCEISVH